MSRTAVQRLTPEVWGSCRCPNCGAVGRPHETVRCAERIVFYICPEYCGFSTWDSREFVW